MSISIRATWQHDLLDEAPSMPVVELWLAGVRYVHTCASIEEARKLAVKTARDLGISVDE